MTYFETPNHAAAYYAGMSVEAYEAMEDALVAEAEDFDTIEALDPDRWVSEADYNAPTAQDWADLDYLRDLDAFEGFHA